MACRVGMTTNPAEREQHWRSRVTGFRNWQILASGLTYRQALGRPYHVLTSPAVEIAFERQSEVTAWPSWPSMPMSSREGRHGGRGRGCPPRTLPTAVRRTVMQRPWAVAA